MLKEAETRSEELVPLLRSTIGPEKVFVVLVSEPTDATSEIDWANAAAQSSSANAVNEMIRLNVFMALG